MGAEGSDRVAESGSEVGSLVGFSLGGPSSGVGSAEGGSIRDSQGTSSLSSYPSGHTNRGITIYSPSEFLSSVYVATAPRGWLVHSSLCCGISTAGQDEEQSLGYHGETLTTEFIML